MARRAGVVTADVMNHAPARRGSRPSWYKSAWREAFDEATAPFLTANVAVLDIGSGRKPTIAAADRPPGCRYVGLDISSSELRLVGAGAYDKIVVRDIATCDKRLAGQFDLALSWQVFEHVKPLDRAIENIYSYLRPGGALVALLSGRFSAFALVNQLVPRTLGLRSLDRLLRRELETVFPAHYDGCYASALASMFSGWSDVRITPRFRGADYFSFSRRLQAIYVRYEDWAARSGRDNLATHYLLVARK